MIAIEEEEENEDFLLIDDPKKRTSVFMQLAMTRMKRLLEKRK